jgi:epoxyqueuosine reductase QueG
MGNRIFGCDDCLAVCPWNKFASQDARPLAARATPRAPASPISFVSMKCNSGHYFQDVDQANRPRPVYSKRADRNW